MKISALNLGGHFIVAAVILFLSSNISKGVNENFPLPGSELTLEQALPDSKYIIIAKLKDLGSGPRLRMPGYFTYHNVQFEVKRFLKGTCEKAIALRLYCKMRNPEERLNEGDTYIAICFTQDDGRDTVLKLLRDNEDTERQVIAALAAAGH